MADPVKQGRYAAIRSLVRDLKIDHDEAEQWCEVWEHFARRYGAARNRYFWDAARGWIDAQRAMGVGVSDAVPPAVRVGRSPRVSEDVARRVDRAS